MDQVDEAQNIGDANSDRKTDQGFETPLDKFRRSAGFQFMFVLHSGLEVGKAIDHLCASAEKMSAALREWQPIETAPKGKEVLVLKANGKYAIADWGRYCEYNGGNFTHWIPLPEPHCLSISNHSNDGQASEQN